MQQLSPTLRKAAVLISALDDHSADALLEQMGPQQAALVRSALVALDDIPAAEQQAVLAEFLRQQADTACVADRHADDVALELHTADAPPTATSQRAPLAFLLEVAPPHLARVLRTEQAQTIAVVVANLPPARAAELLEQLPSALATDAVERLAWLDAVPPETIADLAHSLRQRLRPYLSANGQATRHQTAVLEALQVRQRQRTMANDQPTVVAQRYRLVSDEAPSEPRAQLAFADLARVDGRTLKQVFAAADPQVALVALTGADERLVARILEQLPKRDAALLKQRLEHPGPIRLREIDEARESIAAVAGRLAAAGEIILPPRPGFAAAV